MEAIRKGYMMKEDERLCIRCHGRKRLYKAMGGWCFQDMGGVLADCPMCLGEGKIKKTPAEDLFKETEEEEIKDVKEKGRRKLAKKYQKDY